MVLQAILISTLKTQVESRTLHFNPINMNLVTMKKLSTRLREEVAIMNIEFTKIKTTCMISREVR